jgi:hypothetical protein
MNIEKPPVPPSSNAQPIKHHDRARRCQALIPKRKTLRKTYDQVSKYALRHLDRNVPLTAECLFPCKRALAPVAFGGADRRSYGGPKNQKHPQNQTLVLLQQNQQTMVFIKKPNAASLPQLCTRTRCGIPRQLFPASTGVRFQGFRFNFFPPACRTPTGAGPGQWRRRRGTK